MFMYVLSLIGNLPLALKVLDRPYLRSKGFMGWHQSPNDHYGMLFHHDRVHPQSYWMHTVPFDLDCLGFDEDNCLVEIITLHAFSRASRGFSVPVKHVIEVRGQWCHDNRIKGGEKLIIGNSL